MNKTTSVHPELFSYRMDELLDLPKSLLEVTLPRGVVFKVIHEKWTGDSLVFYSDTEGGNSGKKRTVIININSSSKCTITSVHALLDTDENINWIMVKAISSYNSEPMEKQEVNNIAESAISLTIPQTVLARFPTVIYFSDNTCAVILPKRWQAEFVNFEYTKCN